MDYETYLNARLQLQAVGTSVKKVADSIGLDASTAYKLLRGRRDRSEYRDLFGRRIAEHIGWNPFKEE